MSDGIDVDPELLQSGATSLDSTADYAQNAIGVAPETSEDFWVWGVAGLTFAAVSYMPLAQGLHNRLEKIPTSIEGLATNLRDNAECYDECDHGSARDFDDCDARIED